jgi:hypothetical protein
MTPEGQVSGCGRQKVSIRAGRAFGRAVSDGQLPGVWIEDQYARRPVWQIISTSGLTCVGPRRAPRAPAPSRLGQCRHSAQRHCNAPTRKDERCQMLIPFGLPENTVSSSNPPISVHSVDGRASYRPQRSARSTTSMRGARATSMMTFLQSCSAKPSAAALMRGPLNRPARGARSARGNEWAAPAARRRPLQKTFRYLLRAGRGGCGPERPNI